MLLIEACAINSYLDKRLCDSSSQIERFLHGINLSNYNDACVLSTSRTETKVDGMRTQLNAVNLLTLMDIAAITALLGCESTWFLVMFSTLFFLVDSRSNV
jgi:hypothetical protein